MIKRLTIFFALLIGLVFISRANAQVNIFTDHQVIHMLSHGVNKYDDVRFPTGDYPYLGRVGLEYEYKKVSYQLAYIHRSNIDISGGDEYNYDGVSIGIKFKHCIAQC